MTSAESTASITQHTPGPWVAVGSGIEADHPERPEMILVVAWVSLAIGESMAMANAALIAAAPDLLAAAKRLQGSAGNPQVDAEYAVHALGQDLIAIRAAIAKAEGKS